MLGAQNQQTKFSRSKRFAAETVAIQDNCGQLGSHLDIRHLPVVRSYFQAQPGCVRGGTTPADSRRRAGTTELESAEGSTQCRDNRGSSRRTQGREVGRIPGPLRRQRKGFGVMVGTQVGRVGVGRTGAVGGRFGLYECESGGETI